MKCPNCQCENREDAKFCNECGSKFQVKCPHCNSENLPGDKFCGECGQKLSVASAPLPKDLSFDEKLEKIQRYLPKGLTEKILSLSKNIYKDDKVVPLTEADIQAVHQANEEMAKDAMRVIATAYLDLPRDLIDIEDEHIRGI